MRFLAEIVADVVYSLRIAAAGQWWLRALSAGSLLGAAMLCLWWFPVLLQGWLLAAVVLAGVWTVARPESFAPLGGIATVSVWWLAGAGGGDAAQGLQRQGLGGAEARGPAQRMDRHAAGRNRRNRRPKAGRRGRSPKDIADHRRRSRWRGGSPAGRSGCPAGW